MNNNLVKQAADQLVSYEQFLGQVRDAISLLDQFTKFKLPLNGHNGHTRHSPVSRNVGPLILKQLQHGPRTAAQLQKKLKCTESSIYRNLKQLKYRGNVKNSGGLWGLKSSSKKHPHPTTTRMEETKRQIVAFLKDHGPATAREINKHLEPTYSNYVTIYGPLGKLEKAGAVKHVGKLWQ